MRCLSADCDTLVSGSYDTTLKIWSIGDQRCLTLHGHTAPVLCVQMDKVRIVSGSYDLYHPRLVPADGTACARRRGPRAPSCLQFDERKIISGSLDHTLRYARAAAWAGEGLRAAGSARAAPRSGRWPRASASRC